MYRETRLRNGRSFINFFFSIYVRVSIECCTVYTAGFNIIELLVFFLLRNMRIVYLVNTDAFILFQLMNVSS